MATPLVHLLLTAVSIAVVQSEVTLLGSGQLLECTIADCPSQCQCARVSKNDSFSIDCSSRQLSSIPLELLQCNWPEVESINLSGNYLDLRNCSGIFLHFPNLHTLFLSNNRIQTIHSQCFSALSSLRFLSLDGNQISRMDPLAFTSLHKLDSLLLHQNNIATLPRGLFSNLSNLTILSLHLNQLTFLDEHSFHGLHNLLQLYLHGNQISHIYGSPFQNLSSLDYLYLSSNKLSGLQVETLKGLRSLSLLILERNLIQFVHESAFEDLANLRQLYMDNNQLHTISSTVLTPLKRLQLLRMSANRITSISDNAFIQLKQLSTIYLSNNQIVEITEKTFSGLSILVELVLNDNNITSLPANGFLSSPFLQRLWMSRCKVECISEQAFKGLQYLDLVQLSNNQISYLPNDVFQSTPNIRYIILSSNRLTNIQTRPFRNLPNLVLLSLQFNSITQFAYGSLEETRLQYLQWNQRSDFVGDNSLICDCWSVWLREWLLTTDHAYSSVTCASPENVRGQDIRTASFGTNCSKSSHLEVNIEPAEEVVYTSPGQCLLLRCSSSLPSDTISWSRLNGELRASETPYDKSCELMKDKCNNIKDTRGLLVLSNFQKSDAGFYMCQATADNTTAQKICQVKMGSPPVMLVHPQDQRFRDPGVTVVFTTNIIGEPRPVVTWYHGNHTVIFNDTRFFKTDSGSLIIVDAQKADSGYYRVVADNGAGRVEAQAHMLIYAESLCYWGGCINGGVCVASYYCHCPPGLTGRSCEERESPDYGASGDSDDEDRAPPVTRRDVRNPNNPRTQLEQMSKSIINPRIPTKERSKSVSEELDQQTDDHKLILPDWQENLKNKETHTTSKHLEMKHFSIPEISDDTSNLYPTDKQLKQCC